MTTRTNNVQNSPEPLRWEDAAKLVNVSGWACVRCGKFYANKMAARCCCHTDAPCETEGCPNRKARYRIRCDSCEHKKKIERWNGLEQVEAADAPSSENPLALLDDDTYFFDEDSLIDWCDEHEVKPSEAFLVLCKPHNPPEFEMAEFVRDYMPGEGDDDLPGDGGKEAEKAVNEYIRAHAPWSWYPDYKRRPTDADLAKLDAMMEES